MKTENPLLVFASAILIAITCFQTAFAEPSAAPNDSVKSAAPDAVELTRLLNEFLQGASRNDIAAHERFWADDVIYTSSMGKRRGKPEILADVRKQSAAPATDEKTTFSAEDVRIQQYGATAIVAFQLVGTTVKGEKTETSRYLNTGTFLQRAGKWQVVAWQATKIPAETEPAK
jgi:ketosteroid isomerase-like protein